MIDINAVLAIKHIIKMYATNISDKDLIEAIERLAQDLLKMDGGEEVIRMRRGTTDEPKCTLLNEVELDEWIPHDGGTMPVPEEGEVKVVRGDGMIWTGKPGEFSWKKHRSSSDISKYAVTKFPNGWIEHDGRECPVSDGVKVEAILKGSQFVVGRAEGLCWESICGNECVSAYKVIYEWIEYNGKGRPVSLGTKVQVELRNGDKSWQQSAMHCDWEVDGGDEDIVAYTVVAEASSEGWWTHYGMGSPVCDATRVEVELRSGIFMDGRAMDFQWSHHKSVPNVVNDDIVRYRALASSPSQSEV